MALRHDDPSVAQMAAPCWDVVMSKRALVRPPGPHLDDGLLTHLERSPVDLDLARRQWEGYVEALRAEGWETIEVPPADDCPDAVFVEDTVVVLGELVVNTEATLPKVTAAGLTRPSCSL